MERKTIILTSIGLIVSILAILLIGISFVSSPSKETAISGALSEQPFKIGIIVFPGFAPFLVADDKGFFEKEGINADVVIINDVNQLVSALASGQVDMIISSVDFTTVYANAGINVKEILVNEIGYGADGLVVKDDVQSMNDLKGKTVYLSMGTPSHFLLRHMAAQEGLSASDITISQMEADQVGAAFVAGQIDYGMTWEPWLSKASERKDGKILATSKTNPGIVVDTVVVKKETLQIKRREVDAAVRAWFDALDYMESNPNDANAIMARHFELPVEEFEQQIAAVKFLDYHENLKKFDRSEELNLYELTDSAERIYKKDGLITADIDAESIIDSSVLKELYG